MLYKIVPFYT